MSQLVVYRHQTKWAWGKTSWNEGYFISNSEADTEELLKDIHENINDNHGWSDKYRGAAVEIVKNPTLDTLKKFAKMEQDVIDSATETLNIIQREIQNHA